MAQTSLSLPDYLDDEWSAHIGDRSNSEELRFAIRWRLHVDPILSELFEPHQREKRLQFVRMAVKKEVDRIKENPDYEGPVGDYSYK